MVLACGYNRGNVRGAIKLSYNPIKQKETFFIHQESIQWLIFQVQGVVLFGDKTALTKPSAFDRINVRRLFLVTGKGNRNSTLNSNSLSSTMNLQELSLEVW